MPLLFPVPVISIPNITLNELLRAIRRLDQSARAQVAQVLLETELDSNLSALLYRLAEREPADEMSDEMINAEIAAVRGPKRPSCFSNGY